jgi:hypothetical protein
MSPDGGIARGCAGGGSEWLWRSLSGGARPGGGASPGPDRSDARLVSAAFAALAAGGAEIRWEPFFFDWFCGDEARALAGPRGEIYRRPEFEDLRREVAGAEPDRPERLDHPFFRRESPVELLIDRIEAIWAPIAAADDWSLFNSAMAEIEEARTAWGLQPG